MAQSVQDPTLQGGPGRTLYDEMLSLLPEEPTFFGGVKEAGKQAAGGVAKATGALLKFPETVSKQMGTDFPGEVEESMGRAGRWLESKAPAADPAYAGGASGFFAQDVPAGIGSSVPFIAAGLGASAAGAGGFAIGALGSLIGAATSYVTGYEEMALRDDVSEENRWTYAVMRGVGGLSEGLPIGRMFARLDQRTGGGLRKVLWNMASQAFEEGGQEAADEAWGSFLRTALTPDEYRGLAAELKDVGYSGLVGAAAGGLTAGAVNVINQIASEQDEAGPSTPGAETMGPGGPEVPALDQEKAAPAFDKLRKALADSGQPPEEVEAALAAAKPANAAQATRLGAQVVEMALPEGVEGFEEGGTIVLDSSLPPEARRRSVLAHELSHWMKEAAPDEWEVTRTVLEKDHPDLMRLFREAQVEKRTAAGLPIKTAEGAIEEGVANAAEEVPGLIDWVLSEPKVAAELIAAKRRQEGRAPFIAKLFDLLAKAAHAMGAGMGPVAQRLEALAQEVAVTDFEKADPGRALEIATEFARLADHVARRNVRPGPAMVQAMEMQAERADAKLSAAYHGSPHRFDKFDISKIGTGEGAQAYGHGLYFTGSKDVAQHYRTKLSHAQYPSDDQLARYFTPGRMFRRFGGPNFDKVMAFHAPRTPGGDWSVDVQYVDAEGSALGRVRNHATAPSPQELEHVLGEPLGALYKVELAPAEDEYLLWDEPLSKQSEKVKAALRATFGKYDIQPGRDISSSLDETGAQLYRLLSQWTPIGRTDQEASMTLHAAGIRGIKYLDGSSRGKGEGSYNYVLFSDEDVRIEERFSVASAQPSFTPKDEKLYEAIERNLVHRFNSWGRLNRDIGEAGQQVAEDEDVELITKLHPGLRSDYMREGVRLRTKLERLIKSKGLILDESDDYARFKHAPDRNKAMAERHPIANDPVKSPGSGRDSRGNLITDAYAAQRIQEIESGPLGAAYKEAYAIVREAYDKAFQMRQDAGLLSAEGAKWWRDIFGPDFVSLRSEEFDEDGVPWYMRPSGFQLPAKLSRRAEGRDSTSGSPTVWAFEQFRSIAHLAAKQDVMRTAEKLVTQHPNPDLWEIKAKPSTKEDLDAEKAQEIRYYINGEKRYLVLKGETGQRLANTLKDMGAPDANVIARLLGPSARLFTALATRLSPEFLLRNPAKDIQTAMARTGVELGAGFAASLPKNAVSAMRASRRVLKAERKGEIGPTGQWEDMFRRWRAAGGQTGWLEQESYEKRVRSFKEAQDAGRIKDAFDIAKGVFMDAMDATEFSTRIAVFDAALKSGMSEKRAAAFSRDVTVDFNRKGELSGALNALYWFFNPSVQGTRMVMKTLATPKGALLGASIVGLSYALARYNSMIGAGDDEDDPNRADEMSQWQRNAYMTVLLPDEYTVNVAGRSYTVDRLTIPIGWGYNFLWALGQQIHQVLDGNADVSEGLGEVTSAAISAFSPMGSTPTFAQAVTPSLLDPLAQVTENVSWSGATIMPEGYGNKPDSHLAWQDTPEALKTAMQQINAWTGGSTRRSGKIDMSPETVLYLAKAYTGGVGSFTVNLARTMNSMVEGGHLPSANVPLLRSFVGEPDVRAVAGQYREAMRDVEATAGEIRDGAEPIHPELRGLIKASKAFDKRVRDLRERGREELVLDAQREFLSLYRQARKESP